MYTCDDLSCIKDGTTVLHVLFAETALVTSLAARTPEEGEGGSNVGDIVEVNDGHVQRAVNSDFACIMFKQ